MLEAILISYFTFSLGLNGCHATDGKLHPNYEGCFEEFGCFGTKYDKSLENCVENGDCISMVKYKHESEKKQFHMILHHQFGTSNPSLYIAVGFSHDEGMGDDLVFSCPNQGNVASGNSVEYSYNIGEQNFEASLEGDQPVPMSSTNIDLGKSCEFSIPEKMTLVQPEDAEKRVWDLSEGKYYLLLATGPISANGKIQRHTSRAHTREEMTLTKPDQRHARHTDWRYISHATIMILAWMGSAASGIMIAQHFKKVCDKRIAQKDSWFRMHQFFMALALILSIAALIIIFAKEELEPLEWSHVEENPHPIFGLVCMSLAILNPILAFFRPTTIDDSRWLFNLVHGTVGHMAFGFGILTIFYGFVYDDVEMSSDMTVVLAVYVVIYLLMHAILLKLNYKGKNNIDNQFKAEFMGGFLEEKNYATHKISLAIFLSILWGFAVGIVTWISVEKSS